MKSVRVYAYTGNAVHDRALFSMFEGCPFDKQLVPVTDYKPSDIAVVFGIGKKAVPISWPRGEVIRRQKEAGLQTVILDSGYVRRGNEADSYYAVGIGGLNGRADFRNRGMPADRWEALGVEMQSWRLDGDHILLCGQIPWDASVQHSNHLKWLVEAVNEIMAVSHRPIRYRPHPLARNHCPPIPGAEYSLRNTLAEDIKDCWAAVTYNSNAAVDAVLAGVAALAFDEGSMAKAVTADDWRQIDNPPMPDRPQWAADLAYTQWQPEEMANGLPWRHLYG